MAFVRASLRRPRDDSARRSRGLALAPLAVLVASLGVSVGAGIAVGGCRRTDAPLGAADSYVVYENKGAGSPDIAAKPGSLPVFHEASLDDPRALPIHRNAVEGFLGELLRTDYLAKQLLRDGWRGRMFGPATRAAAAEPTALILGGSRIAQADEARLGTGFTAAGGSSLFGGSSEQHARVLWIEVGDDPLADPAFVQTASGRVGRLIAERLAGAATDVAGDLPGAPAADPKSARPLIDGYALAMEVIGREWRVGEGPQGSLPPNAGTGTQRERFAAVRSNAAVMVGGSAGAGSAGAGAAASATLRPAAEMLVEPGVIAAVIYRMAQSTGIGRKVAPSEIYAPFVGDRVPAGISPAAVLGPIRNFQVKLLCAWAGAILAGHPPHDLADLVAAYGETLPAERAEVYRIFVVTTYGATVKRGGVSPSPAHATAALAELTALSAELASGRRTLRAALTE